MAELEGIINGLNWAVQIRKTPLVAEGDLHIIINISRQLQSSASTSQVSKNWRWEGHLSALRKTLTCQESILFSHVKREGNKVVDALANAAVESNRHFHAEEFDDRGNTQTIWQHFLKLAEDDKEGRCNLYNYLTQSIPLHVNDRWHQYLMGK